MEGKDWVIGKDKKPYWDEKATSQATTKKGDTYLGKSAQYETKGGYDITLNADKTWGYTYQNHDSYEHNPDPTTSSSTSSSTAPSGDLPTLSETGKGIVDGTGIGAGTTQGIASAISKSEPLAEEALKGMSKGLQGLGTVLGVVSTLNDASKIINKGLANATVADWMKLGVSGGSLLLKANPYTITFGVIYGIADAAGYNPIDIIYDKNFKTVKP